MDFEENLMSEKAKNVFKKTLGVILIIFGAIAFVTPFVPFGWLIFVGLQLLGFKILYWKRFVAWLERKIGVR